MVNLWAIEKWKLKGAKGPIMWYDDSDFAYYTYLLNAQWELSENESGLKCSDWNSLYAYW